MYFCTTYRASGLPVGFTFAITSSSLFISIIPRPRLLFPGFRIHTFITPSISICGQYLRIFFNICFEARTYFYRQAWNKIFPSSALISNNWEKWEIVICQQISHVKRHVGMNEESLTTNDLIVPANKLIPLVRPDSLSLLIDVLVWLSTDVVTASFDREIESFERYRTRWWTHGIFVLGIDLIQ